MSARLEIVPLGGLGEIGMNLMAMRFADEILVVDAGIGFPDDPVLGVDLLIPDLTYLQEHAAEISGILLTHGHEDHIGAVPYVLKQVRSVPVYGTPLTLALLRNKLVEHGLAQSTELVPVVPRTRLRFRYFEVEPIRITHSIVDAVAYALRTPLGVAIHTGDFKIDSTPVDGRLLDTARFSQLGDEGVLLLMSDSTNVERPGHTPSERVVGPALERIMAATPGKVVLATFSSNIHRVQQVVDAAARQGRRVAFVGRSLLNNVTAAEQLAELAIPGGLRADPDEIRSLPPGRLVVVVTGSQGEPTSALARIALGGHRQVELAPGDAVILSSRTIPGNETAIAAMMDHVVRRGAEIYHDEDVHVSGHACQEELKLMLAMTRPKYFVPVHGEYRHLVRHARLAQSMGIPKENTIVVEDGQVVEIDEQGARVAAEKVPAGRTFIDAEHMPVDAIVVRDRLHLAEDGIVFAVVALAKHNGELLRDPEIVTRGLVHEEASADLLADARAALMKVVEESTLEEKRDVEIFRGKLRAVLKRYFRKSLGRRPMILPAVIEL